MDRCFVDVKIVHDESGDWLVRLEEVVVGRFPSPVEALSLVSILECSPRARSEALEASSRDARH